MLVQKVASLVGAWIETPNNPCNCPPDLPSRPSWARGLKQFCIDFGVLLADVASLVGAWIETECMRRTTLCFIVASLVGAWIETKEYLGIRQSVRVASLVGAWIETWFDDT